MTEDPLTSKSPYLRELTRFVSAALVWAAFATIAAALILGGASAGVPPFSMLVEQDTHSEDNAEGHGAPAGGIGPDTGEPERGGGVGYIKDTALDDARDWKKDSVAQSRANGNAPGEPAGKSVESNHPASRGHAA